MRRKRLFAALVVLALGCLAGSSSKVLAQAVYGSIVGTVTDAEGAVIPNATVTITNTAQNISVTATTNESGNYEQIHLVPATYDIKVGAQGFETVSEGNLTVSADQVARADFQLNLGAVTQTVEVTAATPLLKTDRADVSTSFNTRQVEDLPIFNRNYSEFELLVPGSQRLMWQHAASENPQGTIQIMVNGQHFYGTEWVLDGTDNRDVILGIQTINPNLDSVTELKMTTADYDAEFGQASAAVMSSQTKSGSNDLHGSAFYFRRDNNETARDPFSQSQPIAGTNGRFVPDSLYNQFGGSLGGPIKKDKTFIFGDYQGTHRSLGGSVTARVPTAAERTGDFTDLNSNGFSNPIFNPFDANGNLLSPASRTQFSSGGAPNVIPSNLLSPQAQMLLSTFIPLPNLAETDPTVPNFSGSGNQVFNSDAFDVRADQYQTAKLHIFGRYSFQRYKRAGPGLFGTIGGGPDFIVDPSLGGFAGNASVRVQSIASGFDYSVNPSWLTDFRFGFYRYRVFVDPGGFGTTPAKDAGIPGLNTDTTFTSGMPYFNLNGTAGFAFGYSLGVNQCNCPLDEEEEQFQFVNNWTHIKGNHQIKFGADIRHALNLRVPSDTHRSGELQFDQAFTSGPTGGGLALANFLLGDVSRFGRYVSNSISAAERQNRWFFYGEDSWRVTPKLTFNYGLRWEIFFPQYVNAAGNGGFQNIATGEIDVAGVGGIGLNGNVKNTLTNFAPRIGLAYQLRPSTVVRVGYGRSYDTGVFGSTFGHTVTQNVPVLAQQSLNPASSFADVFNFNTGPPALDPTTIVSQQIAAGNVGPNGFAILPNGISPHTLQPKMRLPYVDAWNATVEHEFSPTLAVTASYVGNKGTNVFVGDGPNYNINTPPIAGYLTVTGGGCTTPPCTNARRPYFNKFGWTQGVQWYGNDASDHYDALQVSLKKTFGSGFTLTSNYTYAHAFQYNGDYYTITPSVVYGPTDFERNQVWTLQEAYVLPFGKGKRWGGNASRLVDLALGGWQLNSLWNWSTGLPFTPSYNECGSDQDVGVCRPNLVGNAIPSNQTIHQWFIPAPTPLASNGATSGPWSRPAAGSLGTIGFDTFRGPHFFNADISLFKNFNLTEKLKGQFRWETFNTFNHVNLGQPNGNVDSGGGIITSLAAGAAQRTMQFAVRLDF